MRMISFDCVDKSYQIKETAEGIRNAFNAFFKPKYKTMQAVQDVSFKIDRSKTLGLIGENGAGKTTIIKLVCGILAPDAGHIEVLGMDPFQKKRDFKKRVSLLLGNKNQLWWDLPAHESFLITKKLYGLSNSEYRASLEELVDMLDVSDFINSPIKNLSLGQRMRCELLNALLYKPEVILLDEPTIGLDLKSQVIIRNHIQKYVKNNNAACIVTSHNIKDITDMSTDVAILHKGTLIHSSSTIDFLDICSGYAIIEIDGLSNPEIYEALKVDSYQHNDMRRVLIPASDTLPIMNSLVQHPKCKSVRILDASVNDLVENKILSIQCGGKENAGS